MRILIVEDDERTLRFIKRGLEAEQYEVDVVRDGEEAIDLARSHPYSVIILDVYILKKNGLEVCKALRQAKVTIPILIMTANHSYEILLEGFKAGANDYLSKPFPFELLLAKIQVLDRSRIPSVFPEDI